MIQGSLLFILLLYELTFVNYVDFSNFYDDSCIIEWELVIIVRISIVIVILSALIVVVIPIVVRVIVLLSASVMIMVSILNKLKDTLLSLLSLESYLLRV